MSWQRGPRTPNTRRTARLGGALVAAGVLGLGGAVVGLASSVSEVVDSEDIITSTQPITMSLEEGDKRTLWARDWGPRPTCTVLGPDRRPVELSQSSSNVSQNGQEFQSIGHFEADEAGNYVATCANGEARLTEGSPYDGLGIGIGGIFAGVLAIIAGGFVMARGAVRRVGYEIRRPRPRPRHRRAP